MRKRGDIADENQEHMSLVADLYAFFIKHQELNHAKILEQDYLLSIPFRLLQRLYPSVVFVQT